MAGSREKLIIVGDGETAELAYDYFKTDSDYDIVAFSAEKNHCKHTSLLGLPVLAFEEIERYYHPQEYRAFVAISYTQLNGLRKRLFNEAKAKGYRLCSYISPKAYIGNNVEVGENCFILENVTLQRGVKIGDDVTIWSGSSVGHRSTIENHCFLASHTAISGFCHVGEGCFLGVNSCTAGGITIGNRCVIGAGAVLVKDAIASQVYVGNPAKPLPGKSTDVFVTGEETI